MLLVCPHCATSYRIAPGSLGEGGRSVRCVSCLATWFEVPRPVEVAEAADHARLRLDPATIRPPLDDVIVIGADGVLNNHPHRPDGDPDAEADAEFREQIDATEPAPSIVPAAGSHTDALDGGENTVDVESFAARRPSIRSKSSKQRFQFSKPGLPALIGILLVAFACLLVGRHQIVRHVPQTASLYALVGMPVNLRGLAFENVKTTRDMQDGVPVLIVEGNIVGTTPQLTDVPNLRFAVLDGSGKEIYAWTAQTSRTLLPPGETLPFRSRLASPPAEASGVTVRFFSRRDSQAGFK